MGIPRRVHVPGPGYTMEENREFRLKALYAATQVFENCGTRDGTFNAATEEHILNMARAFERYLKGEDR